MKKSKSTTDKDSKSQTVVSDPIFDPDFYFDTAEFVLPNGDIYEGDYCAHRNGLIWREGFGTYTTKDGQIYKGQWLNDQLIENMDLEINFPSGAEYYGPILRNKYNGLGTYILDSKLGLLCNFVDNKPTGEITLVDSKGREWHGAATETEALLLPEHIYFNNISEQRGKGQSRRGKSLQLKAKSEKSVPNFPTDEVQSQKSLDKENLKELELKIFAKTRKTLSDLQFEESDWYKNYMNFKRVYEEINRKVKENGVKSLEDGELAWWEKYLAFKKDYMEICKGKKLKDVSENKLFELYNSTEYKESCPPISVFYPRDSTEDVEDENVLGG